MALVVGVAGGDGAGKSTLARQLAIWLDGIVMPLAGLVKFVGLRGYGPWVLFKDSDGRKVLRDIGMAGREEREGVWVDVVRAFIKLHPGGVVIIPDVRFRNEAEEIRRMGGVLVRVRGGVMWGDDLEVDYEVERRLPVREMGLEVCRRLFGLEEPKRKGRIYLSLPISGDVYVYNHMLSYWLEKLEKRLAGIEVLHPGYYAPERESEDYVKYDLQELARADGVVCLMVRPSVGCAMEMVYAKMMEKLVVCCSKLGKHQWVERHSDFLFENAQRFLDDVVMVLSDWLSPK